MFDTTTAVFFYSELYETINSHNEQPRKKVLKFYSLFKSIFKKSLENESQYFSSSFAQIIFALDKFKFPEKLSTNIKQLRRNFVALRGNKIYAIEDKLIEFSILILSETINHLSNEPIPENLSIILSSFKDFEIEAVNRFKVKEKIDFIRCVAVAKIKSEKSKTEIICESNKFGTFKLQLFRPWKNIYTLVWKSAVLNVFNVFVSKDNSKILSTGEETIIVLEPDYLIDVTDISECFQYNNVNTNLFFLRRFNDIDASLALVSGNIINTCFDELISNPNAEFEETFNNAMSINPLQVFALAMEDSKSISMLRSKVESQFENLQKIIMQEDFRLANVEPSFISPDYGLQGRLDLMIEYSGDIQRKDIIELKSGKAPSKDISFKSSDGKIYSIGIWNNHLAQTTCYNLLLDSTFNFRTGSSKILYSSTNEYPLRNAPNIIQKKQEILNARNWIIAHQRALANGKYSIFIDFTSEKFGTYPPFAENEIIKFSEVYTSINGVERDYFHGFISFVLNEMYVGKLGSKEKGLSGFSSLWKNTIFEKNELFKVLSHLVLDLEKSDFEKCYLIFNRNEGKLELSSMRKGDLVILYPMYDSESVQVLKSQLLKCTIKEISQGSIKLSIRNKLFNKSLFHKYSLWALEHDYLDTINKKLFSSLYSFINADKEKRHILFGIKEPIFATEDELQILKLNENQVEVVNRAINAKDYFLIQGPPGTGKTSYVLKSIVENIYNHSEENILVLAYTNRAVDEICTALKRISEDFPFLRTGSKESSEHTDKLISYLSESISLRELYIRVRETRIIVSTVSSIITNPDVMQIKSFHTAIIDEASQILEPQIIGILSKVKRFIMIGDEMQLPAVVVQDENQTKVDLDSLKEIGLIDFRNSLFERLLACCIKNGWDNAYGMLRMQARMHSDIQDFPNKFVYNMQLELLDKTGWQKKEDSRFHSNSNDEIETALASSRMIFIESQREISSKVHYQEAELTLKILQTIKNVFGDDFDENTVGVITPFRAQCAEIYQNIPVEIKDCVRVDTVERFQGSERNIIIISFAVNHEYLLSSIQSLVERNGHTVDRKLNVAMTRAKEHLIFLGNSDILKSSKVFENLISFIQERGGYFRVLG